MLIVGLTGGMACGKSFVGAELERLGAYVVEADALGHEVMEPGTDTNRRISDEFPVAGPDGRIDRTHLAAIVFNDPAELAKLNAIVHPAVHELAQRRFREIAARDPHAVIVYAAAIMVETGGYKAFPKLIVVACTREQQLERAMQRPGAKEADILARLDRQLPVEKKKEVADFIIDAGGTREETLRQTKMVFEELRKLAS